MKQLILTFFLVILCYSLFFDKKPDPINIEEVFFIQKEADNQHSPYIYSDTANFITSNTISSDWLVSIP